MNIKRSGSRMLSCLLAFALCIGFLPGIASAEQPEYIYETIEYYSSITGDYVGDTCYYTDSWFNADPATQNDSLALISAQVAAAATDGERGAAVLKKLGFEDAAANRYDSTDENDCAYIIGTKDIETAGGTARLVAVAFQGAQYGDKGWQQNVTVNKDGETTGDHASFSAAAKAFLEDYDKLGLSGNEILWIVGQSRGGAVADVASAYMLDRKSHPQVFCYTFETPATTENEAAHDARYGAIHNYIRDDDPVTKIPMWGMTRYGTDVVYNTATLDEVKEQLAKMNPDALEYAGGYNAFAFDFDVKGFIEGLVGKLEAAVSVRADYSKEQSAEIAENETITYSYQGGLQAVCHVIFGGGDLSGLVNGLGDRLEELLINLTYARLEEAYAKELAPENAPALLADSVSRKWGLAVLICDAAGAPESARAEIYGLAEFLGKVLVDTSAIKEDGWTLPDADDSDTIVEYMDFNTVISIATASKTFVFSHHPDMIIARLKMLAPAPDMENVALTIAQPAAGDKSNVSPDEVTKRVASLDRNWLTVRDARWLAGDKTLSDGMTYYLQVTLAVAGHSVPEDFKITINDEEPIGLSVEYENGVALITGQWKYELGDQKPVMISFDNNGHGEVPETVSVNKGSILKYTELTPPDPGMIKDDTGRWLFNGWYDENGTKWDDITANSDMTVYAGWTRVIDEIVLTYDIPKVGDTAEEAMKVGVPEGAPYTVSEVHLYDEEWYTVEVIENNGTLMLYIFISPVDDAVFWEELGEFEWYEYLGTLTINGEEMTDVYLSHDIDEDTGTDNVTIGVDYMVNPKPNGPDDGDEPVSAFIDVPENAYFAKAVEWAVKNSVTKGTSDTTFSPGDPCTRAQMLTFLWRAAGSPEPAGDKMPFVDVKSGSFYEKAVIWAYEQGIAKGMDKTHFCPDETVTRAQTVTFLYRFADTDVQAKDTFEDVPADSWYAEAVTWAVEQNVTKGTSETTFSPGGDCLRAQAVTFLYRAMGQE